MKSAFLLLLRRALHRTPGGPPEVEAEPAWHQLLGKKSCREQPIPRNWSPGSSAARTRLLSPKLQAWEERVGDRKSVV